jgi:hypothetical protein
MAFIQNRQSHFAGVLINMTDQEVFDKVVAHLRSMPRQSSTEVVNGRPRRICAYRGDAGLKCAIGIFIPDELYVMEMEETTITRLIYFYGITELKGMKLNTLQRLQSIHDQRGHWTKDGFVGEWSLERLALDNNLSYKGPQVAQS